VAGEIDDAIERADREGFTRQPPKTLQARINFLMKQLKTTKAVAAELGVSQRSVERYRKGRTQAPTQGDRGPDRRRRAQALAATGPQTPTETGRHHTRHHRRDQSPLRIHRTDGLGA
jgi:hypothetical protein